MTPLFKKLNWKGHNPVPVINAPPEFKKEMKSMLDFAELAEEITLPQIEFAIVFATTQLQIEEAVVNLYPKLKGDAVLWLCYPKKSSKRYTCEINRDTGWNALGNAGMEPVRQVAVDEDWSALRFRKVEFIKTITRRESFALSEQAKKRTTQKGV